MDPLKANHGSGQEPLGPIVALANCPTCGKPSVGGRFCCLGCETVHEILNSQIRPLPEPGLYVGLDRRPGRDHGFYIEGVHCSQCVWLLEKLPEFMPAHVARARIDLRRSILSLTLTPEGRLSEVAERIHAWGYTPRLLTSETEADTHLRRENRARLLKLGIAGALAGNIMVLSLPYYADPDLDPNLLRVFEWGQCLLSIPSLLYCGAEFLMASIQSFRRRRFSIDLPITLALIAAFVLSTVNLLTGSHEVFYDSQSALIFLLLSSRYLLQRFRQRGLGGSDFLGFESVENVQKGDLLEVREGQLLFDAQVLEGEGFIDQAILTGESAPVKFSPSDFLYAGTTVVGVSGPTKVLVIATGRETRIERILKSAKAQLESRSMIEHVYDLWAKRVLIAMTSLGAAGFLVLALQNQWEVGAIRWITLLIVTCPCSLALGTPLAIRLAVRKAFRQGLLIQDSDVFEKLRSVRRAFFDKTGTLTEGRLQVTHEKVLKDLRPWVYALASRSRHPVSRAIAASLSPGISRAKTPEITEVTEFPGVGVAGTIGEAWCELSRSQLSTGEESGVDFKVEGKTLGTFRLTDRLRDDAILAVSSLHRRGIQAEILSGDHAAVVTGVGRKAGVEAARGGLSPEEKAMIVRECRDLGVGTLMIGDGVNDAEALASATVSFAVQGSLEEVLKVASVVSSRPGLAPVEDLFKLSDELHRVLRRNLWISTGYNVVAGTLAMIGVVTPLIAALVMPIAAATVFTTTMMTLKVRER